MSLRSSTTTSRLTGSTVSSTISVKRSFHVSASVAAKPRRDRDTNDPLSLKNMPKFNHDDIPTLGHLVLQRQREVLKYLRTIEFEIPKLKEFQETYNPPSDTQLLRYRFQHYQGEAHPASRKVVLTVDIAKLFKSDLLQTDQAKHKFLLLAGPRFQNANPTASVDMKNVKGEFILSCESMPCERQNLKWCSDTFDQLMQEANTPSPELASLAIDPRPDLVREAKRRIYFRKNAPSIKDFPKEWL